MEETEISVSKVMPLVLQVIDGGSEIGVLQATSEEDCQKWSAVPGGQPKKIITIIMMIIFFLRSHVG